MANYLPLRVKVRIIKNLVEGASIRATSRLTEAHRDVVMRLGLAVGLGCMKMHDQLVHDIEASVIEVDELWAYVGKHERRLTKADSKTFGDAYTYFALDVESKLVPSYLTGGERSLTTATRFMKDLRKRVVGTPQMSVDGWPHWAESVRRSFGHNGIHLGSTVKEYQKPGDPSKGGSFGRVKSQERKVIFGSPELDLISTSKAERLNLTSRMQQRRVTRLTNAYSKKKDHLIAAMGLHFFHYNFCRVHETIHRTPAMAARIADHVWTVEELTVRALDEMGVVAEYVPRSTRKPAPRKTHQNLMSS